MKKSDIERLRKDPESIEILSEMSIYDIKKQLKERRRQLGMTQADLANRIGVNQPTISYLENPKRLKISLAILQKAAAGLDVVVNYTLRTKNEILDNLEEESS